MKITIKHYAMIHSVEMDDASDIDEVMDAIVNLVVSAGYHKENIQDWINENTLKYEELSDCCSAPIYENIDICSECKEHC